jgi:16S rRNA (guanine527-N7)-methyltransferase
LSGAHRLGLLGPGPVDAHIDHSLGFATALDAASEQPAQPPQGFVRAVDLGTGGGIPGLVLALVWADSHWVLIDGSVTRAKWVAGAVKELDLAHRVDVVAARAEQAARTALRASADIVVARSFAPPAVTVECAAPFLRVGGLLAVADPPGEQADRWPPSGIGLVGLVATMHQTSPVAIQVMRQKDPCPERYPRRTGVPSKRPLF